MSSKLTRGFLDGALSTLGVVIGASAASAEVILAAGLGGAFANGVSNVLSAFAAESIEGYGDLRETERAMVSKDLRNTVSEEGMRSGPWRAGIEDGGATLVGGGLPVLPYLVLDTGPATLAAAAVVIAATFLFGMYLGKISKRNLVLMGAKTAVLAVFVAVTVYVVQHVLTPSADV